MGTPKIKRQLIMATLTKPLPESSDGMQVQRLNNPDSTKSMRQAELHRNMQILAEMTSNEVKGLYKNAEWFHQKHVVEKFSISDIAVACGMHYSTVFGWCKSKGYQTRKYRGMPCTPEIARKIGEAQMGSKNHMWKGGRCTDILGYVKIKDNKHPFTNSRGYVQEHRLVMEKMLGRYLNPYEIVHHKNHKRNDNRPENLELLGKGMHHRVNMTCPHCGKKIII